MSLPRPVSLLFFFFGLVSSGFRSPFVGGEPVCYIHLMLHDVKKKCFLTSSSAEYFCHFQTAWWLTAFHARAMLLWRRDGCYHSLVTYIYILPGEGDLFFKHIFFEFMGCRLKLLFKVSFLVSPVSHLALSDHMMVMDMKGQNVHTLQVSRDFMFC